MNAREQRWPLHPLPSEWETLESWVRRIAAVYGMSFGQFVRSGLGRSGPGACNLDTAPDADLGILSRGTGVPLERLRAMTTLATFRRAVALGPGWTLTEEGQATLGELSVSARRLARRSPASRRRGRRRRKPDEDLCDSPLEPHRTVEDEPTGTLIAEVHAVS